MTWSYYQETKTGDYILVRDVSRKPSRGNLLDAAGPDEPGDPDSAAWDMVTEKFLREDCLRVDEQNVPKEWREALSAVVGGQ